MSEVGAEQDSVGRRGDEGAGAENVLLLERREVGQLAGTVAAVTVAGLRSGPHVGDRGAGVVGVGVWSVALQVFTRVFKTFILTIRGELSSSPLSTTSRKRFYSRGPSVSAQRGSRATATVTKSLSTWGEHRGLIKLLLPLILTPFTRNVAEC